MPPGMFLAFGARLTDPSIPVSSPQHPSHLCTNSSGWRTWGATVPGHPHFEGCRGHSRAECLLAHPDTVPCPAGTRRHCLALSPRPGSSVSSEGHPPSCRHGGTVPVPGGDSSSSGRTDQPRKATSGRPLRLGAVSASLLDLSERSREISAVGQPGLAVAPCPSQPG